MRSLRGGRDGLLRLPYAVIAYPYMMVVLPRLMAGLPSPRLCNVRRLCRGALRQSLADASDCAHRNACSDALHRAAVGRNARGDLCDGSPRGAALAVAFVILAAYTYSSGLRAPAVIAIVKDLMLYIMVLAAVIIIPIKLGGYGRVFSLASQALATHTPPATIYIKPAQYLGYATLAIGSALALMLYPHTATAVLSAKSANVVSQRRNASDL